MHRRAGSIFLSLLSLVVTGSVVLPLHADNSASPATAIPATYDVKIAGYASGTGTATSSGTTISITANVEDENGNSGTFVANNLTVDEKGHFKGTGTVLGKSMKIAGRLDDPKPADTQLKGRRIVGSFVTSDMHYGRIAGFVPPASSASGAGGNGNNGNGNNGNGGAGGSGGGTGGSNNGNGGSSPSRGSHGNGWGQGDGGGRNHQSAG